MLGFQDENEEIKNLYFTSEDPQHHLETFVAFCDEPFEALTSEAQLPLRQSIEFKSWLLIDNYKERLAGP